MSEKAENAKSTQGSVLAQPPETVIPDARTPSIESKGIPSAQATRELFDSYALAVEMADRISARRSSANKFFLSLQTSLLTAVGLADTTLEHVAWYSAVSAAIAGCTISVLWWLQLRSYQQLNQAKFDVIIRLEELLPAKLFTDEWKSLQRHADSRWRSYIELGVTERVIPWLLATLNLLLLMGRLSA